jgi:hypothetical protein
MKFIRLLFLFALLSLVRAQQPVTVSYASNNTAAASWTSATTVNTRVTLLSNVTAFNSILVTLVQGTTITGGIVTLQQSNDNTNWVSVQCVALGTTTIVGPTYTLVPSTNVMFMCPVSAPYFGVLLSTAITGTGTVVVGYNALTLPQVSIFAGTVQAVQSGTWNVAQSGTWTVSQATGSNLHVVLDSGTTAVTQATGTNLHTVIDSGSTVVTQSTAANLLVSVGGNLPAGTNVIGGLSPSALTTASVTATSLSTTTSTTGTNVKAGSGNLYGLYALNGVASTCWVQFMNSASTGTLGTLPILSVPLPASTTQPIWIPLYYPVFFSNGIAIGTSTLNNGTVACGTATAVTVFFK